MPKPGKPAPRAAGRRPIFNEMGCHQWPGSTNNYGYPKLSSQYMHRTVYLFVHGWIPYGHVICHTCDNPPCIRADHLFAGTQQDNIQDMMVKGRGNQRRPCYRCGGMNRDKQNNCIECKRTRERERQARKRAHDA